MTARQDKPAEPVYGALLEKLERDIRAGRYQHGDSLPPDGDLAGRHRVTRYAVQRCYAELARRGLVRRVKHRGTVVTYNPSAEKGTRKIGLVMVSDVPSYYLFQKGVEQVISETGAEIRARYNYNIEAANRSAIRELLDLGAQGLIVAPPPASSFEPYRTMVSTGVPVVLAMASDPGLNSVSPDERLAGLLIGEHFGERGFRAPAVVTDDGGYARVRIQGFREGLARHGVKVGDERLVRVYYANEKGELAEAMGRAEADRLLAMKPRPDAVLAVNDAVAMAVYYWLLKRGLRVPEDIAVAGIDGLGPRFHPFQLTTVDLGLVELGREAARILLDAFRKPGGAVLHRVVTPKLVVSGSTARA